jgi:hypothetical protein
LQEINDQEMDDMTPTFRLLSIALVLACAAVAFFGIEWSASDEDKNFPQHSIQQ